ncbi:MAG TPA: S-layer homology domain-containing protein, partial [Candidatus Absconditabacterales bacterium]|nr:S-layer homology domain-containing protein [Candidatus Absconditabacterales bacterium]
MKNFKKLFSIVAIVAMMLTTVPTATLGAASYSAELEGAYDYAYGIGITTQGSIETANMYGTLIRSHMAKMMVNYAKEVKGLTPDTSLACEFTDVANETAEMKGYITEACQMGLMGQGITAFNPNGVVTRAQFGTVLSRVLYGDANDGGDPYYAEHLQALKDAGIMTKIDNPNAPEVRGYVMLMMQRASGDITPAICETPENVLSCSLGLDTCPAECVTNEVKAGDLSLSLASGTPASMTSIPQNGIVNFAVVDFKAQSEDIKVNSVTVTRQGLGQRADISRIYFERNGMRVSGRASLSTDNTAVISFSPALIVKKNSTETLDLVVNVVAATAGGEHAFKVTNENSSAASASYNITTPTLRTSNYQVGKVEFDDLGSAQSVRAGESNVELGQFKLTNTSSDNKELKVKAITLRQNESADLKNLSNLAIYRD